MDAQTLTVKEAAVLADRTEKTIRRWIERGVLVAYQALPGAPIEIETADLDAVRRRTVPTKPAPASRRKQSKSPQRRAVRQSKTTRRRPERPGRRAVPARLTKADLFAA